jgi:hypothetical protein
VLFRVDRDRGAFLAALEGRGVLMVPYANGQVRAVTHHGIERTDIERTLAIVADVLRELPRLAPDGPAAGSSVATGAPAAAVARAAGD